MLLRQEIREPNSLEQRWQGILKDLSRKLMLFFKEREGMLLINRIRFYFDTLLITNPRNTKNKVPNRI